MSSRRPRRKHWSHLVAPVAAPPHLPDRLGHEFRGDTDVETADLEDGHVMHLLTPTQSFRFVAMRWSATQRTSRSGGWLVSQSAETTTSFGDQLTKSGLVCRPICRFLCTGF